MLPVPSGVVDPHPPRDPPGLASGDPLSGLSKWLADGRVDDAAARRARQRWLERQAAQDATLAGVIVDLAERGGPVVVRTNAGATMRGHVVAVGADFVAVRERGVGDTLIPHTAICTIRAAPGEQSVVGDRLAALEVVLAEALVELAADRRPVRVVTAGAELRGQLRSAGRDVVVIATDGDRRDRVHVTMSSLDHLVMLTG
jgi:hypothetical protein